MNERPPELDRLDQILRGAGFAHELIFDRHRKLLEREPARTDSAVLLAESARIAAVRLPRITAALRGLSAKWADQSLLDPEAADKTAEQIAEELKLIEPELRSLTERQAEIATKLRGLLGS